MSDTKTRILDAAEHLTQTRGFNGFSYIDLSEAVGVKTSSIHYYFRLKADLGLALVKRLREAHLGVFRQLDAAEPSAQRRIAALVAHFQTYVLEDKICLCGVMAAELHAISEDVRRELRSYFNEIRGWLSIQFKELNHADPIAQALTFIAALEGAVLIARLDNDPELVSAAMSSFS